MEHYDAVASWRDAAGSYDDHPRSDTAAAVDFLAEEARGGPALELAIGTGRVALPLAAKGIRVAGVDLSAAMVAQLRAKPGGDAIEVTVGDAAEVPVSGSYRLVYVVYNSLFNLATQDAQVRCFENVAAHLSEDGVFVVEALVPDFLARLRGNQYVAAEEVGVDGVWLDVARWDPVDQRLDESHVHISAEGDRFFPVVTRCPWPSELDLMARIAGLRLHHRWGGWDRSPFDAGSELHVSVYGG